LVVLFSMPLTFVAVALASTVSPAATVGVLALTLFGATYVVGSGALGGYLSDQIAADRGRSGSENDDVVSETPIDRLKRRYVDGDLSDAEFERRLERLVAADDTREGVDGERSEESRHGRESERHERERTGREH